MPRGGARPGAGRPKVNSEERSEVILNELILPAARAAKLMGDIYLSPDDIEAAYGRQGLRDWQTWFEMVDLGHGIGLGAVKTRWRLKLKLVVAAKKLLTTVDESKLPFPPEVIRRATNEKAYGRWSREYAKVMKELAAEFGHREVAPPPFNPDRNYLKVTHVIRDGEPRGELTDSTKGWAELVIGGSNGFEKPYDGFVPDETDFPY